MYARTKKRSGLEAGRLRLCPRGQLPTAIDFSGESATIPNPRLGGRVQIDPDSGTHQGARRTLRSGQDLPVAGRRIGGRARKRPVYGRRLMSTTRGARGLTIREAEMQIPARSQSPPACRCVGTAPSNCSTGPISLTSRGHGGCDPRPVLTSPPAIKDRRRSPPQPRRPREEP